jgi:hypothetical protein
MTPSNSQLASPPNPLSLMQVGTTGSFPQPRSSNESLDKAGHILSTLKDRDAEQKLSEVSKQYIRIVQSMERTLSKLNNHMSLVDEKTEYDAYRTNKGRQFAKLDELQTSLDNLKSQAGELLWDDSKTNIIVQESRQIISSLKSEQEGLDDYPSQPLDSVTLERRKHLCEVSIKLKGCLDQLEGLISMLHDQDSSRSLFCHVVQMYKSAKHNASAANDMLGKISSIEGRGRESFSEKNGQTRFRLQSPSATIVVSDEADRWNSVEARFSNLPTASPIYFELTRTPIITRTDKHFIRLSDSCDRKNTERQPLQIFSPPQICKTRNGWDVESSVDRDKLNSSMQFHSPRELQSTSLMSKAKDNLSRFSRTPEKGKVTQPFTTTPEAASELIIPSRSFGTKRDNGTSFTQTEKLRSTPDYRAILKDFLEREVPEKLKSLDGWLEKYKVRLNSQLKLCHLAFWTGPGSRAGRESCKDI